MNIISRDCFYVQAVGGKTKLTTRLSAATPFEDGAAEWYISHKIPKKDRILYKIIPYVPNGKSAAKEYERVYRINSESDIMSSSDSSEQLESDISIEEDIKKLSAEIQAKWGGKISALNERIKYFDDAIIDILHYIRRDDVRLNAYQGYLLFKNLQKICRERVAVKKELAKIKEATDGVQKLSDSTNTFEFKDYQPRVVQDCSKFATGLCDL